MLSWWALRKSAEWLALSDLRGIFATSEIRSITISPMKKILDYILGITMLASLLIGCKEEPREVLVDSIQLNETSIELQIEETKTLTVTIKPIDATNKTITWSSSDASVAKVSDGVVTAEWPGSTVVTATCGLKTATCKVTVVPYEVYGITLDKTSALLNVNKSLTLTATVTPFYATDKTVIWSSSNTEVATVTDGVVTPVTIGKVIITAKAGEKEATCSISVVETPDVGNIQFQDDIVEQACVNRFDTDKDGELSYEEASWVTDITGLFPECETITSFDELIYFFNITELPANLFKDCYLLESVTIPSSVTKLGDYCFYGCKQLSSIDIPSLVTELGEYCFGNCGALSNITIPSMVTILGNHCFDNCFSALNIGIPSSINRIGDGCFAHCTSLSSIIIPSSVNKIGDGCFAFCTSLTSIEIPSTVTEIGENCFYDCTSLNNVEIPSSVTTLGNNCFYNCSNLSSMRCYAVSVPTVGDDAFNGTLASSGYLYVPENSVSQYTIDPHWKVWKNILKLE